MAKQHQQSKKTKSKLEKVFATHITYIMVIFLTCNNFLIEGKAKNSTEKWIENMNIKHKQRYKNGP